MKKKLLVLSSTLLLTGALCFSYSYVDNNKIDYKSIEKEWISSNHEFNIDNQIKKLEQLFVKTNEIKIQNNEPELHYWKGVILSSLASANGGLTGLSYAKEAKLELEAAISIKENTMDGLALSRLGVLYSKVPSWPIGFSDKNKAEQYFKKSMNLNKESIEPILYWLEYLKREERTSEIISYIDKIKNHKIFISLSISERYLNL